MFIPRVQASHISDLSYANAFPTKNFAGFRLPSTFLILSQSKLSKDKIELLEGIGIDWRTAQEKSWDEGYSLAKSYFSENGNLNIAARYVAPNGFRLGRWIGNQRALYRKGKLSYEKIKELECIGIYWDMYRKKESKSFCV